MRTISLEELLEAGCHFGHQVTRHNPRSRDFVFEARDNIHIIDLAKTKEGLEEAGEFIKSLAGAGGTLLVVGTKRQARPIIEEEVKRVQAEETADTQGHIFYITTRWIGGILTNFTEIAKNVKKLKDIEARLKNEEERAKYTKKEIGLWQKELAKLRSFYGGILEMKKAPDALFIIDTHNEDLAVREAKRTNVQTAGIVDTNSDPVAVNYAIPANDDAVGSIKLITGYIIDSWIEGRKSFKKAESKKKEAKEEVSKVSEVSNPIKSDSNVSKVEEKSRKAVKKPAVKKKKEEKTEKDVVKEVKEKKTIKKEKK